MLWKHDRPAESHIKVNGRTKIITFVLLKGYMEFYYAFLPFLAMESKCENNNNISGICILLSAYYIKEKAPFSIRQTFSN